MLFNSIPSGHYSPVRLSFFERSTNYQRVLSRPCDYPFTKISATIATQLKNGEQCRVCLSHTLQLSIQLKSAVVITDSTNSSHQSTTALPSQLFRPQDPIKPYLLESTMSFRCFRDYNLLSSVYGDLCRPSGMAERLGTCPSFAERMQTARHRSAQKSSFHFRYETSSFLQNTLLWCISLLEQDQKNS